MSITYKTIITDKGGELLAAALLPDGTKLKITHFAVGDGNGSTPTPSADQTTLVHEVYRGQVTNVFIDESDASRIVTECIIDAKQGGFWIREVGVYSESGDLVAVCNVAESYKPLPSEGAARIATYQVVMTVTNTNAVTLTVAEDAFLPDASTTKRGLVKLSSRLDSDSETEAATSKAVKQLKDLQDEITNNYHAVTTGFTKTRINKLIDDLKIVSGDFKGVYRYLNKTGGINWYFLFLALHECEGKIFTLKDRVTIAESAMRLDWLYRSRRQPPIAYRSV